MTASFPISTATAPAGIATGLTVLASHVANAWEEVVALENELLGSGTGSFLMSLRPATSGSQIIGLRGAGEAVDRLAVTGAGAMTWGGGTAAGDVTLQRSGARVLSLTGALSTTVQGAGDAGLRVKAHASQTANLIEVVTSANAQLFAVEHDGDVAVGQNLAVTGTTTLTGNTTAGAVQATTVNATTSLTSPAANLTSVTSTTVTSTNVEVGTAGQLRFGGAADAVITRQAAHQLKTDQSFVVAGGVATKTKSGAPVDGDFSATPADGTLAVDLNQSELYVRANSKWVGTGPQFTQAFMMMGA